MTTTEVARSASIEGSAMLTTDSSIKAMLDARMAATNTHGLALEAQSGSTRVDLIAASSHGPALRLIIRPPPGGLSCVTLQPRQQSGPSARHHRSRRHLRIKRLMDDASERRYLIGLAQHRKFRIGFEHPG